MYDEYDNNDDEDIGLDDATQHALRAISPEMSEKLQDTTRNDAVSLLGSPLLLPGRPLYRLVERGPASRPPAGYSVLSDIARTIRITGARMARWRRGQSDRGMRLCTRKWRQQLEQEEWEA